MSNDTFNLRLKKIEIQYAASTLKASQEAIAQWQNKVDYYKAQLDFCEENLAVAQSIFLDEQDNLDRLIEGLGRTTEQSDIDAKSLTGAFDG